MQVLHLGHQGWAITSASKRTRVLVDHVDRDMGHGLLALPKYPASKLNLDYSSFHAIIISHEHADHFELRMLAELFRANPEVVACVPDLSSPALPAILRKIGFRVLRYSGFEKVLIGDLEVTALPCEYSRLEPDLYGLLFRDQSNGATFLTSVDGILSAHAVEHVLQVSPERSLDNFTNNYVVRPHEQHGVTPEPAHQHRAFLHGLLLSYCDTVAARRVAITGLGWAYPAPFAHLNAAMFPVKHGDLLDHGMADVEFVHGTSAGEVFDLFEHGARLVHGAAKRLKDERAFGPSTVPYASLPAYPALGGIDMLELQRWLREDLARLIGIGAKHLCEACHDLRCEGTQDAFVFVIQNGGTSAAYRFDFAGLAFIELDDGALDVEALQSRFAMGLIVPAMVLDAIRRGRDEAHICFEVACKSWNHRWDLLPECADVDIAACLHPRYRSGLYFDRYANVLAELAAAPC
jgi:hypothetical protein